MTAALITFIGGEEAGDVGRTVWQNPGSGERIEFPVNVPVRLDTAAPSRIASTEFIAAVIATASKNRFFRVEMVDEADADPDPQPVKRGPGRPRKAQADAEDAG